MKYFKKLILIGGIAGSGKSTIAKYISKGYPFVYVDKDNVTRPLLEALLCSYNHSPHDRESQIYIEKVRPFEYLQFEETLFHLASNNYIIGAAPFLKEFQDKEWLLNFQKKVNTELKSELVVLWVDTIASTTKQRLITRNERRDDFKLSHFNDYCSSVDISSNKIKNLLSDLSKKNILKSYIVSNYDDKLFETYSHIDNIIYEINNL